MHVTAIPLSHNHTRPHSQMGTESFLSMASFVPFISALNKAFLCTQKREGRKERERGEYNQGGEGREIRKTSRFAFVWQRKTFGFVLGFGSLRLQVNKQ